jgi:Dimerisation domain
LSAFELGLFTELAKEPFDGDALRQRLGLDERGTKGFLDALVALRMVDRVGGIYANTAGTDLCPGRNKPSCIDGVSRAREPADLSAPGLADRGAQDRKAADEVKESGDLLAAIHAEPAELERESAPCARARLNLRLGRHCRTVIDVRLRRRRAERA